METSTLLYLLTAYILTSAVMNTSYVHSLMVFPNLCEIKTQHGLRSITDGRGLSNHHQVIIIHTRTVGETSMFIVVETSRCRDTVTTAHFLENT